MDSLSIFKWPQSVNFFIKLWSNSCNLKLVCAMCIYYFVQWSVRISVRDQLIIIYKKLSSWNVGFIIIFNKGKAIVLIICLWNKKGADPCFLDLWVNRPLQSVWHSLSHHIKRKSRWFGWTNVIDIEGKWGEAEDLLSWWQNCVTKTGVCNFSPNSQVKLE